MGLFDQLEGMEDILNDFIIETNDLIDGLNEDILLLESGESNEDLVNRIFRAFHTIKGTSGFLSFEDCTNLAHAAEELLNQLRSKQVEPGSAMVDILLETTDWFKNFIVAVENRSEQEYDISPLTDAIGELLGQEGPPAKPAPQKNSGQSENIPPELLEEYVTEVDDILQTVGNDLLSLEIESDNQELVNDLFRAFHTIKGNSALIGQMSVANIAHKAEDILDLIRKAQLEPNSDVIDALLATSDKIKETVRAQKNNKPIPAGHADVEQQLDKILWEHSEKIRPASQGKDEGTASSKSKGTGPVQKRSRRAEQTIRVDVNRIDSLVNLAGELVLEKNRLLQLSQDLYQNYAGTREVGDLDGLNNSLGYITTEIQESVMKMRMLPISNVFRKFPRLIRDLAHDKKKEIKLITEGEDTELDRSVIEAIGDPLVHLLRNAVDHGIEAPRVRKSAGKPECGTVHLSAFQEGNHIIIKIADDGAGIDPDRIAQKAIENKIITADEARNISRRELIHMIFEPGFSTAKVVTDVSGRGVGMDVVHSNISKLNGSIDIDTELGQGTTFTIKLPLTLTIMTGLVVRVQREYFIIPLSSILDTVKLSQCRISTIKEREVIRLRDSIIPLIRLGKLLHVPVAEEQNSSPYVVIIAVGEVRMGLVVSELLKQEETVVKPLGHYLGKVSYVAGASIRGDGRISLILDIPEMMELLTRKQVAA